MGSNIGTIDRMARVLIGAADAPAVAGHDRRRPGSRAESPRRPGEGEDPSQRAPFRLP